MKALSLALLLAAPFVSGQYYNISTVAGNGRTQIEGAGGPATNARLISPELSLSIAPAMLWSRTRTFIRCIGSAPQAR